MTSIHFKNLIMSSSLIFGVLAQAETPNNGETLLTTSQAWGFGLLTGLGVSLIGLVAALFVVGIKKCIAEQKFKFFLNLLYSLGCGAMIGDAMIHILPEAYSNQAVYSSFVSLIFIAAVSCFIIIERSFVACGISHQHWQGQGSEHGHNHGDEGNNNNKNTRQVINDAIVDQVPAKKETVPCEIVLVGSNSNLDSIPSVEAVRNQPGDISKTPNEVVQKKSDSSSEEESQKGCLEKMRGKRTAGYLNLISSFIHNFFDGFAIGAAFASKSSITYIPVIIAIFAHEIPREMGDVGILMKSNFDGCQTIFWNAIINTVSMVGVVVGLGIGSIGEAVQIYILTFVAGNFIYIGADIWRNLLKNKGAFLNIIQFIFFSVGVGAMYLVLLAQN